MLVNQDKEFLVEAINEAVGEAAITTEDLTDIVDFGKNLGDYITANNVDNFVKALWDRIGRTVIVAREYKGKLAQMRREAWEFGSALLKPRFKLPEPEINDTWASVKGEVYSPFKYMPPEVSAKIFNSKNTYEILVTFGYRQVMEAFTTEAGIDAFFAGLRMRIQNALEMYNEILAKRVLNAIAAAKIASGNNVVNLLADYNTANGTSLTAANALSNPEFLRYIAYQMRMYSDYISEMSMLYNNDGYVTHTPKDYQHLTVLSAVAAGIDVYLQSDVFHNELTKLPAYETVSYWQGTGTGENDIVERSTINATVEVDGQDKTINQTGVIAILRDRDCGLIANEYPRTYSIFNPDNETTNHYYKWDASYLADLAENCVVFVVADSIATPTALNAKVAINKKSVNG